jgi:hypothetical protein
MRPFPHLQMEQDNLIELSSQYGDYFSNSEKVSHESEFCRLATNISQVRIEIVYPQCVGRAPQRLIDESMIEMDLAGVLIHEIMQTPPSAFLYDSHVAVLSSLLNRRFHMEQAADGLWAKAVSGGLDSSVADVAVDSGSTNSTVSDDTETGVL